MVETIEVKPKEKDRRLAAILALGMLLLGVAAGVELCRRWFFGRIAPVNLAGDYEFKLPPPAPPRPPLPPSAPPQREMSASHFLKVLATESPKPVARKFLQAFMKEPRLKRAFQNATKAGLARTPAKALLNALMREPAFRDIVVESRSDPAFRDTFAKLAQNAEVGGTLRSGSLGLVRAPSGLAVSTGGRGRPVQSASARPYSEGPPPVAPPASKAAGNTLRDERLESGGSGDAHQVNRKLGTINTAGEGRNAVSYFANALTGLSKEQLIQLEEAHDEIARYLPPGGEVQIGAVCNKADLDQACRKACAENETCPNDVRRELGLPSN